MRQCMVHKRAETGRALWLPLLVHPLRSGHLASVLLYARLQARYELLENQLCSSASNIASPQITVQALEKPISERPHAGTTRQ